MLNHDQKKRLPLKLQSDRPQNIEKIFLQQGELKAINT